MPLNHRACSFGFNCSRGQTDGTLNRFGLGLLGRPVSVDMHESNDDLQVISGRIVNEDTYRLNFYDFSQ